jgi:hypothetical protein
MKRLWHFQCVDAFQTYENEGSDNQFSSLQNNYLEVNETLIPRDTIPVRPATNQVSFPRNNTTQSASPYARVLTSTRKRTRLKT